MNYIWIVYIKFGMSENLFLYCNLSCVSWQVDQIKCRVEVTDPFTANFQVTRNETNLLYNTTVRNRNTALNINLYNLYKFLQPTWGGMTSTGSLLNEESIG